MTDQRPSYTISRLTIFCRMGIHVSPHRCPVPTLVDHSRAARPLRPLPISSQLRTAFFDGGIRTAQHALPQVAQAMLDVVREARAVRDEADTDDVQAVQLVHHRDLERAAVRTNFAEAVGLEERAPLVVVEQAPVVGVLPDETDAFDLDGQLVGVVVPQPGYPNVSLDRGLGRDEIALYSF